MMHKVVGLTLNYRDPARTSACVTSLLDEGAEHVLVWDNSEDDGYSSRVLRRRWTGDSRVTIRQSERNLGFAAGVNRGVNWICQHHPGAWIMLINNDAVLRMGALNRLATVLAEDLQAKLVYPSINHGGRVLSTMYYHRLAGWIMTRPVPGAFPYPSGCALLIAPERLRLPVFDEDFFMYGEDWLLGWRFKGTGALRYVPEVLVDHVGSASSIVGSRFYESYLVAAHLISARKLSRGLADYGLSLVVKIPSLIARAVIRTVRLRSVVPLLALAAGTQLACATHRDKIKDCGR